MTLPLLVDATSALPVFEQIQTQVVDLIVGGQLAAGARLPPVRALAATLGIAPNTVAKAYKELERQGFLVTAGRRGTVVADQRAEVTDRHRQVIRTAIQPLLDEGMTPPDILRLVRSVLENHEP